MVLGVLLAVIAAPGLLGTQEAIRQSQSKEKREEHRARRCNLIATCVKSSLRSREIDGRPIVLRNGKLYIDTGTEDGSAYGHQYAGYYLPYPDEKYEGLVTTITEEAPIMNWVYVDKESYEVKYGVRLDAQPNLTGPFDCTRQDRRLTFDGWEGWCAVEESPTVWTLYFDKDDNGLVNKVPPGTRVLEIELSRKEKRWKKEAEERQQDQTTQRAVDTKEEVPMDKPVTAQPHLDPPGVGNTQPEPFKLPTSIFPQNAQAQPPNRNEDTPDDPPAPKTTDPRNPRIDSPPSNRPVTPQLALPEEFKSSPPSNDRPGILNRNRNSKALAQAQMFEALAQKSSPTPIRNRRPASRPTSDTSSVYSGSEARGSMDVPLTFNPRSESATPVQLAPVPSIREAPEPRQPPKLPAPANDPAIFGGFVANSPVDAPIEGSSGLKARPVSPNNQLRRRPSIVGGNPSGRPPNVPLPRVPTASPQRRTSPPLRSRNAALENSPLPATARRAQATTTTSTSARKNSTSTKASSPRTPQRRLTMAQTMTTGGKGSIRRNPNPRTNLPVGSPATSSPATLSPATRAPRKTTSTLYRELDDLLKMENDPIPSSAGSGSAQSNQSKARATSSERVATLRGTGRTSDRLRSSRSPPRRG